MQDWGNGFVTMSVLKCLLQPGLSMEVSLFFYLVINDLFWVLVAGYVKSQCIFTILFNFGLKTLAWQYDIDIAGSVSGSNCKELGGQTDVDGFLVGGASLKVNSWSFFFNQLYSIMIKSL